LSSGTRFGWGEGHVSHIASFALGIVAFQIGISHGDIMAKKAKYGWEISLTLINAIDCCNLPTGVIGTGPKRGARAANVDFSALYFR